MPVGGGPAMMNNYMIAQPPGFQLAAFVSAALFVCLCPTCSSAGLSVHNCTVLQ